MGGRSASELFVVDVSENRRGFHVSVYTGPETEADEEFAEVYAAVLFGDCEYAGLFFSEPSGSVL